MKSGTIRVEIDDFDELHTVDELKKPVKIGGVEWTLGVFSETSPRTANVRHLGVILHCQKSSRSNLWSVTARCQFKLCRPGMGDHYSSMERRVEFRFTQKTFVIPNFMNWEEVLCVENGYISDNTAVVEAVIHVESMEGIHEEQERKKRFKKWDEDEDEEEEEKDEGDVILNVKGKKIYVAKDMIVLNSKILDEIGEDLEVKNVDFDEFLEFLNAIYGIIEVEEKCYKSLLILSKRFRAPRLLEKIENFLIETQEVSLIDKLKTAETYRFSQLQHHCLSQLKTTEEVLELANHKDLGAITSEALFQRISEISKEKKDSAESKC